MADMDRSRKRCKRDRQAGFVLLEAVAALPVLILLLTVAGMIMANSWKAYRYHLADEELQQEVRQALDRVTEDMLTARRAESMKYERGVKIYHRKTAFSKSNEDGTTETKYYLNNYGRVKLVQNDAFAPMTGDHALAGVTITEFFCRPVAGKTGLYELRLEGKSEVTGHVYSLCTAVYLPDDIP